MKWRQLGYATNCDAKDGQAYSCKTRVNWDLLFAEEETGKHSVVMSWKCTQIFYNWQKLVEIAMKHAHLDLLRWLKTDLWP